MTATVCVGGVLRRRSVPVCWPQVRWWAWCLAGMLGMLPSLSSGQTFEPPLAGDVAKQRLEQLRMDDAVLRSEISSAQVARQAEITRLEGRIARLEEQRLEPPASAASLQLAYVLGLAVEEPQDLPPPVAGGGGDSPPPEAAATPASDTLPAPREATTGQPPRPIKTGELPAVVRELVVQDYRYAVEIDLLAARARLLEKSREVTSLERLSGKGLASPAHLDMQRLHRRQAELQVQRLEHQLAALERIYPAANAD